MKVKKMDQNGHSSLIERDHGPDWIVDGNPDVSLDVGRKVVEDYLSKGYILVDQRRSKVIQKSELNQESEVVLMPPIVGG